MQSLTQSILDAFRAQWPRLAADPAELVARIQRRRDTFLQRPPRAWCIALRANDRRMTPRNTGLDDPTAPARHAAHRVHLTAPLVRRLIEPITLHWMGRTVCEVADLLGVRPEHLRHARRRGVFTERAIPGLAGSRGRPVPILSRAGPLDPTARGFLPPAGYWGHAWQHRGLHLPDDFDQWLERRPAHCPRTGRFRRWHYTCPACNRGSLELFYPLQVPHAETYLNLNVAAALRRAQEQTPSLCVDRDAAAINSFVGDDARGPLFPPEHVGHDTDSPDAPVTPNATFACDRCHRINHLCHTNKDGWNAFVSYLTCGLLYGRDVPCPPEFRRRQNAYRPRTKPNAAPRRAEVLHLLLTTDWKAPRIARALGMSPGTVHVHARRLYRHHNVHTRAELRAKLNSA